MGIYERILVPTDGSSETVRAVEHAIDLAAAHDATLHAVYVMDTATYAGLPMDTAWEGVADLLHEEGEAALDDVRSRATAAGVPVETALREGKPGAEIVRAAEDADCDLIVMGTHGRGGIDRLLLGSVAEKVVRSASMPVLTVRVGEDEDEE